MNAFRRYSHWNWAWNLDSALRYGPLIQSMKKHKSVKNNSVKIVEVGSGNRGISSYAKLPSYGVDINFNSAIDAGLQERIRASGENLPFEENDIDIVLSVDMLEHVAPEMRAAIVEQMFKVVSPDGLVYIAVPCGKLSEQADTRVNDAFIKAKGKAHPMLVDHVEHGLPSKNEIQSLLDGFCKDHDFGLKMIENTPIWLWEMNLMFFAVERWLPGLRHFQRLILQPLFPVLSRWKSKNNYRVIFICTKLQSHEY